MSPHSARRESYSDPKATETVVESQADVLQYRFHIVCHDCTYERLARAGPWAWELTSRHRTDTDHDVEYARVDQYAEAQG